jgi:hypothetical protein
MLWHTFLYKYNLTSHHMKLKNIYSLAFDIFGFWPTIICKNILKIFHNNDMIEDQTWYPRKKFNVIRILAFPYSDFIHKEISLEIYKFPQSNLHQKYNWQNEICNKPSRNWVFVFILCKYLGKAHLILLLNSIFCLLFLLLCSSYKNGV